MYKSVRFLATFCTAGGKSLRNARPKIFTQSSGDCGFMNVDFTLPGDFAFESNSGMVPDDGSSVKNRRQALISLGSVTVTT